MGWSKRRRSVPGKVDTRETSDTALGWTLWSRGPFPGLKTERAFAFSIPALDVKPEAGGEGPVAKRDTNPSRFAAVVGTDVATYAGEDGHERGCARGRRRLPHLFRLCA